VLDAVGLLDCWNGILSLAKQFFFFFLRKNDPKAIIMENSKILIKQSGFKYFDKLPVGFCLVTIDDFIADGKRKIRTSLFSKNMIPFIEDGLDSSWGIR
jgi:hypothetical protein